LECSLYQGLGEFFYKNKIDFGGLVKFPFNENVVSTPTDFPRKNRSLLGLGGGKDSIVVAEILKSQNKDFDLITGVSGIQQEVSLAIGKKPLIVKRELDPNLFDINKESGVYNGHVPVSVYYAFILLLAAVLFDYKYILVGNEKSANYGNVEYLGEMINHQWSKSEEFENFLMITLVSL